MANKYTTIKVPEDLVDALELFRGKHPEYGFRNRSEMIVSLIRRAVIELSEDELGIPGSKRVYPNAKKFFA